MRISDWSSDVCSSDLIFDDVESGQSVRRAAELSQEVAVGGAYVQEGPGTVDVGPHHRQARMRPGFRTPYVGRAVQHDPVPRFRRGNRRFEKHRTLSTLEQRNPLRRKRDLEDCDMVVRSAQPSQLPPRLSAKWAGGDLLKRNYNS